MLQPTASPLTEPEMRRPKAHGRRVSYSRCPMGAPNGRERRYGRSREPGPDPFVFSTPRNRVSLF
jgi:hypothetical protein